jgi:hypothetical protein
MNSDVQFVTTETRDDGLTVYWLNGTREDGSTYQWHCDDNPANIIACARLTASAKRREAEQLLADARALESAAFTLSDSLGSDLLAHMRAAVLSRIDWAAYFIGREHTRRDVWPVDKQGHMPAVRAAVLACQDILTLERWTMICEAMDRDWADQLMREMGLA